MTLQTGISRDGSAKMDREEKQENSELLNLSKRNKALPRSTQGQWEPFKETGVLHTAEKLSQALTGAENATMHSSNKQAFGHESTGVMCEHWTISQRSLTFHWKLSWQLHPHVMWQVKNQSALLEQGYDETRCSTYKIWLNKSINYFLPLTIYLEMNETCYDQRHMHTEP